MKPSSNNDKKPSTTTDNHHVDGLRGDNNHEKETTECQEVYPSYSDSVENGTWTNPSNQVAVVTVWAPTSDKVSEAVKFYKELLGLRPITPTAFETDGTFLVVMEGTIEVANTKRRWPMFALQVPDLDQSVEILRKANVSLPWGIEEDTTSRWFMFNDPAGNLIELAQFL